MTARTKLGKVAIVDEADLCVESQLFLIRYDVHRRRVLSGLHNLTKCDHIIFLSSSMQSIQRTMLQEIFNVSKKSTTKYEALEVFAGQSSK